MHGRNSPLPPVVLGLTTGCCPDPLSGRHLIHGRVFKTAADEDGNHNPAGGIRDVPWAAIPPVVNAIRVLETIVPDGGLLFDSAAHTFQRTSTAHATALGYEGLRDRIEDFACWASDLARRLDRPHEIIPTTSTGRSAPPAPDAPWPGTSPAAPGGLIALAILRTTVSAGYASRSRDGIHELLDIETARATADTLTTLHADLAAGTSISGPAARRAVHAAAQAPAFAGTIVTRRQARDILDNPNLAVYDNPNSFLMCVYNRDRALCHHLAASNSPSLDRCQPTCANIARTDHHAAGLRAHADALERQSASEVLPGPLADRLARHAEQLRELASRHKHDRIPHQEPTS